jgi:hypothetical protein
VVTQRDPAGRAFKRQLGFSGAARQAALQSIRSAGYGRYVHARIGGPVRGQERLFKDEREAVRAIHRHYDIKMMQRLKAGRGHAV